MSDEPNGIHGIHYEISKPVQNREDGYYYQRVRQVDGNGNLVGVGEQIHRSANPGSTDGLVGLPVDLGKLGRLAGDVGQMTFGGVTRNSRSLYGGAAKLAGDLTLGITGDYKSWPGSDKPWEPLFDWQTGSHGVDYVRDGVPDEIGNGSRIGNWWDRENVSRSDPQRDAWANIPIPNFSPPPPVDPAWNDVFVRDSAAAAGVPSRNNVFEYGFPEPSSVQPSTGEAPPLRRSATEFVPFHSSMPLGGLAGRIAALTGAEGANRGGLPGLIREYLHGN